MGCQSGMIGIQCTCTNSLLETKLCQNKWSFLSINQNVIPNEEETCFVTGMISVNQKFVDA